LNLIQLITIQPAVFQLTVIHRFQSTIHQALIQMMM
ncbi:hypothetical protein ACTFIZ_007987, partial [Dictyostelium cf. discoideum]